MTRKKSSRQQMSLAGFDEEVTGSDTNGHNDRSDETAGQIVDFPQVNRGESAEQTGIVVKERATVGPGDLVVLVDSHSLIYQVFHAMPTMTAPDGTEVGAIHGFFRDLAELRDRYDPEFLICTFDVSDVTFRNDFFPAYKANRESMPAALVDQIPRIREGLAVLGIPCLFLSGYEADDLLATLSVSAYDAGAEVLLVTSDKDCRQLLNDKVQMLNIRKGEKFGPEQLSETWGIRPDQVVDFQAMVGDSVDNVPGVPKIGPKAAKDLLDEYDNLDGVYANLANIKAAARQKTLAEHRDQAYQSRTLVELKRDVPIEITWEAWRRPSADRLGIEKLFQSLGFRRLAERFLNSASVAESKPQYDEPVIDRSKYRCIDSPERLDSLVIELTMAFSKLKGDQRLLSIDTETTSTSPTAAELVGIALAWPDADPVYIPVRAPAYERNRAIPLSTVQESLNPLLNDASIAKVGQNLKYDLIVFQQHGFRIANVAFDTMMADYLCAPGDRNHSLDELSKRYIGHEMIPISQLIGSGKDQITIDHVPLEQVTEYAAEDADVALRLVPVMRQRLATMQIESVFHDLEMPLIEVLTEMERNGIAVDLPRMESLRFEFEERIVGLRSQIFEVAQEQFNPDSPKQLAALLFDRLQLRVVKRTKSGPSTDVEVLQELALEHPLPALIIEYRQATKLKSTYIDALPRLVNPKTGRVHTSFRQDVAATGRLSSSDPNLQNIPIRTEDGRRIRSAFRAGPSDWLLLAADYSQIELRMMAHFCGDKTLTDAFLNKEDIHAAVAAEVYGVSLEDVSSAQRRSAKAINFGILYGQSPFGLAKSLGIDKGQAAEFIDAYFERFSGVREFMSTTLQKARNDGFVSTMSGRRRYLDGIRDFTKLNSNQQKTLLEPERMAVNTVIQGSAADLIKIAMLRVHKRLAGSGLAAKLLLQIHDELLFEVSPADAVALENLVTEEMTQAASLSVPLDVDVKTGTNWADC